MKKLMIALTLCVSACTLAQLPPVPPSVTKTTLKSTAPEFLHMTLGDKLRVLAAGAQANDPFAKPYMLSIPPWQPSTAYCSASGGVYTTVVKDGNIYQMVGNTDLVTNTGTSGTTGPSGTWVSQGGAVVTDNNIRWEYEGPNLVTQDPLTTTLSYSNSLAVTSGNILVCANGIYAVTTSGTTNSTGSGPSGTTGLITNGTAVFEYYGPPYANPYAQTMPALAISTTAPSVNYLFHVKGQTFSCVSCQLASGGSGYSVGDTITLTGGTSTINTVLTVTSVNSGAVTGVSVSTAGSYTGLPTSPVNQGSTSGSGSGATFYPHWPTPWWCTYYSGYNGGTIAGGNTAFGQIYTYQPALYATPKQRHCGFGFSSNCAALTIQSYATDTGLLQILMDQHDGNGWVRFNQGALNVASTSGAQFYTLTFVGGQKRRDFKLENTGNGFCCSVGIPSAASIRPLTPTIPIKVWSFADSIDDGNLWSAYYKGFATVMRAGKALGISDMHDGSQGGTGWTNAGSGAGVTTNSFAYRIQEMLADKPDMVWFNGSTNDNGASSGTLTTAVISTLTACRNGGFSGPILVWGVWSVGTGGNATESTIQAAVASLNDPNIYFVPVTYDTTAPWITGSYNNNPVTPAGSTYLIGYSNFTQYINNTDMIHPCDLGMELKGLLMADTAKSYVWNKIL